MIKLIIMAATFTALATGSSLAACPPLTAGETAEEIKANEQRIVCLQRELADDARFKRQDFEINRLNQTLRNLELQRRFDALPGPVFVAPPPVLP
jgi:hypothetical protein